MEHFDERVLAGLAARIYEYRLLHIVFGSEPSEQELSLLGGEATDEACRALARAGFEAPALITDAVRKFGQAMAEPGFLDTVRGQYTRLFMVPGDACVKPWESVYASAEGTLFTARTLDVRARYEALGFKAQEKGHFPEDHLSMMLDFMAAVSEMAYEAAARDDAKRVAHLLEAQRSFAAAHLSNWLDKLADVLTEKDASGFFAAFARTTVAFVRQDERFIRQVLA